MTLITAGRTYFLVGGGEGTATLQINHLAGGQSLELPVYPEEVITEALPLMEASFAHYAAYWPDLFEPVIAEEGGVQGFYVLSRELPERIADPANQPEFRRLAVRVLDGRWHPQLVERFEGLWTRTPDDDDLYPVLGIEDIPSANELGIPPPGP